MNKFLLILGLMVLLVTPLRAEEEEMEEEEEYEDEEEEEEEEPGEHKYDEDEGGEDEEYITKGEFVETDGKKKHCNSHEACYDQREPQAWCLLKNGQSWTNKGCFCEDKMHSCVIERKNNGKLEYSYCAPQAGWQCSYD